MSSNIFTSKIKALPRAYWTLSSIEFLFWFAAATATYLTILLQKQGFQPDRVGFINASCSVVAIIASPFWGMMADRFRSIRKIFIFCIFIAAIFWALVPSASRSADSATGALGIMFVIILAGAFFRQPAFSLVDAFVVQRCDLDQVAYGHVRLWGSISFAVMCFFLSWLLPKTGVEITFYLFGLSFLPLIIIMGRMKNADMARRAGKSGFKAMGFGRLFKNYYFITYLFFGIFIHIPMSTSMAFMPFLVASVGGDTAQYGLASGYKALLEIPMLLLMRPLRRKFPLPLAIGGAALLFAVEALLYSRAGNFTQIIFIQTLHGLGGGLLIGAASNYVYSLAPEGLNSTAHTLHGAANSIAAIIGNLMGGVLIVAVGIRAFYRIIFVMLLFALLYFGATLFIGVKFLKKPLPFKPTA